MKSIYDTYEETIYEDKIDLSKIQKYFNDYVKNNNMLNMLRDKFRDILKKVGETAVINILKIYYVVTDSNVPLQDKMAAYSCLAYVISPIDAVPDHLPAGYADDVMMVAYVMRFLSKYITNDITQKAQDKYKEWFGKNNE